ncbi:hypothetical protein SASPL_150252 [Salvia splendens]|uniref:Uncharacterized protein n=1 Tax=Salvia splendens TaxID=180675 RepID=A0A8X8W744_SALSN|nr:hypothetical protein SASPL_150252 [Salvia splendens]
MGWPFLGETMELASLGCQKLVQDRMQKHSQDVFKTSLLGENMAVLCGADGIKFIFKNQNKPLRRWVPPSLINAMVSIHAGKLALDGLNSRDERRESGATRADEDRGGEEEGDDQGRGSSVEDGGGNESRWGIYE